MGTEVGGMRSRQVPVKGENFREVQGTLHVLELEVECGYYIGGTGTTSTIRSLWDANTSGVADETQTGGYM